MAADTSADSMLARLASSTKKEVAPKMASIRTKRVWYLYLSEVDTRSDECIAASSAACSWRVVRIDDASLSLAVICRTS